MVDKIVYFDDYISVDKEIVPDRKTPIYHIYDVNSVQIATIKWYGAWRKFCFFPEGDGVVWDNKCLNSIVSLLDRFNKEWKEQPKQRLAVDFDGTLVSDEYPNIGNPNMELISHLQKNRNKYILILNTLRKGTFLEQAVEYMKVCGIEFDYINENDKDLIAKYGDSRKIAADYYIDDRNLTLDNWKRILEGEI